MNRLLLSALTILLWSGLSYGQDLPSKIRGYKVHQLKVHVTTTDAQAPSGSEASIRLGQPRLVEAGLTGVTLETTAEVRGISQSGDIDLLTFKDIVVNGIPIDAADYEHPFKIRKGETIQLPVPLRGSVSALNIARAGYAEYSSSRAEWRVTGTVFVFGRFKKFGMTFKRVIPVPLDLSIVNPMPALLGQ